MHEHLGAERLRQDGDGLDPPVRRRIRLQARVLEILGPDAQDQRASDVVREAGAVSRRGVVDREPVVAEGHGKAAVVSLQHRLDEVDRGRADEAGDELVDRLVVEHLRRVDLLQAAAAHDGDPIAHRHRLDLVVCDVDRRHAEASLQLMDLRSHLHSQLGVEVRQRLVHQERVRLAHDRAPHRHALPLAARQRPRLSLEELLDLERRGSILDPPRDVRLRQFAKLQPEREILLDGHVWIQRVVLEDHRDVSLFRRQVVDDLVVDAKLSVGDLLQAGGHPQSGRLAAARRTDHHHQLAVRDRQIELGDGQRAVVEDLRDLVEFDRRQRRAS